MNIHYEKIGFIGAGNMANALIKGLIASEQYTSEKISASDNDPAKLHTLSKQYGIEIYSSNSDLVRESTVILVAVKPQVIRDVLKEIKGDIRDDQLIISIAAGISTQLIRSLIDHDMPIIRVMPNTPALIQKGISALAPNKTATSNHMAIATGIFHSVGETVEVDEEMMNAVTALSGSGPGLSFGLWSILYPPEKAWVLTHLRPFAWSCGPFSAQQSWLMNPVFLWPNSEKW